VEPILFEVSEIEGETAYATAYTDSERPRTPTEVWEMSLDKFPADMEVEPGMLFWLKEVDGLAVVERHAMHDKVWTQEELDDVKKRGKEMFDSLCPPNPRLKQWAAEHCTLEGEEFMDAFGLFNPMRVYVMLRHQVRDVAEHAMVTTAELAEYYRAALEEGMQEPSYNGVPNTATQHLTNMNPYGISPNGEVPLAQCQDGADPEYVEWVYVGDLLPERG
jgi:hypothetical protein